MALELMKLKEQLVSLRMIYEDAVRKNEPGAELNKLVQQINTLENLIAQRKEWISRNQSPN